MLPASKPRPVIILLPDAGPAYVPYGRPSHLYMGACQSGNATGCGAVAWDIQAASGARSDITPYITVSLSRVCGLNGDGTPQVRFGTSRAGFFSEVG
jgi:hypothetical protein